MPAHKSHQDWVELPEVQVCIEAALQEDLGPEWIDATSVALVPPEEQARALLVAREPCHVAGTGLVAEVFQHIDKTLDCTICVVDGRAVKAGTVVMEVRGAARSILTAERTALNFMQRMCGIATLTAQYVAEAGRPEVSILDTRKTTPGLRAVEKHAVVCGGGANHRAGLYDAVLIKDNHLATWRRGHGRGAGAAVVAARARFPDLKIAVEVDTLEQLEEVLVERPDQVLLDNMPLDILRICAARCQGICRTEASGGITLETVCAVAATGVDAISVGALTHSATAIDLGLDFAS